MVDLTDVLTALIGLVVSTATVFIVPWIRGKIGTQKLEQLQIIARLAVQAAEQLGLTDQIDDKLTWAMDYCQNALKTIGVTFDEDIIRAAIEAALSPILQE